MRVSPLGRYCTPGICRHNCRISICTPTGQFCLPASSDAPGSRNSAVTPLAELERQAILDTLRQLKGDKLTAARLLGIGKTTLYRKLKEYGLGESVAGL